MQIVQSDAVSIIMAAADFYLLCINKNSGIQSEDLLVLICPVGFSIHIIVIDYFSSEAME